MNPDYALLKDIIERNGGLMNQNGLANRWGITRQSVGELVEREGFPAPVYVNGHRMWFFSDADLWRRENTDNRRNIAKH